MIHLCFINFLSWEMSLFSSLAVWGNEIWPSSKKVEIFQTKRGSEACRWSSVNDPGIETLLTYPFLKLEEFPFLIISTMEYPVKKEVVHIYLTVLVLPLNASSLCWASFIL